ncbi:MAG: hypothetical protein R3D03_01250 [Geminicoccaceae bacterium]
MRGRSSFSGLFGAGADLDLGENALTVRKPGRFTKMVDEVEHVTFSGSIAHASRGRKSSMSPCRCVIRLFERDGLVATEIMPGIAAAGDIAEASKGRVRIAENAVTRRWPCFRPGRWSWTFERVLHLLCGMARLPNCSWNNNPARLNAFTI